MDRHGDTAYPQELSELELGLCLDPRHESMLRVTQERLAHTEFALATCRDISVAMGVLMGTRGIDRDAAFDVLRTASQSSQIKIRDLAVEYLRSGQLPIVLQDRRAARRNTPRSAP